MTFLYGLSIMIMSILNIYIYAGKQLLARNVHETHLILRLSLIMKIIGWSSANTALHLHHPKRDAYYQLCGNRVWIFTLIILESRNIGMKSEPNSGT